MSSIFISVNKEQGILYNKIEKNKKTNTTSKSYSPELISISQISLNNLHVYRKFIVSGFVNSEPTALIVEHTFPPDQNRILEFIYLIEEKIKKEYSKKYEKDCTFIISNLVGVRD